jgi:gliding motility-associated protein GldE
MTDLEPPEQQMYILAALFETSGFIWSLVLILFLLLCSAMISASEIAFFSLTPQDLDTLKKDKNPRALAVLEWKDKPKELLSIILIVNNFVNVGIVILGTFINQQILDSIYTAEQLKELELVVFLFQVVLITLVLLLFGEMIPKLYANRNPLAIAQRMATPLRIMSKTPPFSLLSKVLMKSTEIINKKTKKIDMRLSSTDLEQAVALTKELSDSEEEHKMLEGIVKFGNTEVCQIMNSRVDTVAIDVKLNFKEVYDVIVESGFSRFPVHQDSFDNIVGILYVKDLLEHINKPEDFNWQNLLRPAFFVPENKKIDDLLKNFQEKKMHMAVVVDEYGGANGIVTLEDVLEEIVGDITDEFDDDEVVHTKVNDYTFVFEGKTPLLDLYKVMDLDAEEYEDLKGDAESVAGFIIEQSGRIMRKNERLTVNDLTFIVEAADKKRVKLVRVIKNGGKNEN